MKKYKVKRFSSPLDEQGLGILAAANIDIFPWLKGYTPRASAKLYIYGEKLVLSMEAVENEGYLRAEEQGLSAFVHEDSCMEFFFMPDKEKLNEYINIEINPKGAAHIAIGSSRHGRRRVTKLAEGEFELKSFCKRGSNGESIWGFTAYIDFALISRMADIPGYKPPAVIPANFYICGDKTPEEHYGVWNDSYNETPDFHRPEFFGELEIE